MCVALAQLEQGSIQQDDAAELEEDISTASVPVVSKAGVGKPETGKKRGRGESASDGKKMIKEAKVGASKPKRKPTKAAKVVPSAATPTPAAKVIRSTCKIMTIV